MTEDEAKTKWCPHARAMIGDPEGKPETRSPPYNRMVFDTPCGSDDWIDYPETLCIASACMAWRWKYLDTTADHHPMMSVYPPPRRTYTRTEQGYCGLAGSPS